MTKDFYQMYGVDTAMHLLRPSAKWEITNTKFTRWEDPRPCPTWEEVLETLEKIKAFEDGIKTIWTEEQIEAMTKQQAVLKKAVG
jgi:hypothetical protein